MKQISFSEVEFEGKKRTTRREVFLSEMEKVTPWAEVLEVIGPHYPKGKRDRPPVGLERMLRVYLVQQWYGLSDEQLCSKSSVFRGVWVFWIPGDTRFDDRVHNRQHLMHASDQGDLFELAFGEQPFVEDLDHRVVPYGAQGRHV